MATHITAHEDGRLSGIVLADEDVWLDQLQELVPLPPLVTLSGCNGMQSYVFPGDEHFDIAAACLQAGAQHIVGSLWPLLDYAAVKFMRGFYDHWYAGHSPAEAVAYTQRADINAKIDWNTWGGFCCAGMP